MGKHRSSPHYRMAEKILLQPWFLPQRITLAIHAIVPPDYWNKMRYYFDDYGCIICEKESEYHSNGMCFPCYRKTRQRMLLSVKRHLKSHPRMRLDIDLFRQEKLAKKLLGRFAGRSRGPSRKSRIDVRRLNNPVYDALSARPR